MVTNTYFISTDNGIIYTNNEEKTNFIKERQLVGGMVTHFTKDEPFIKQINNTEALRDKANQEAIRGLFATLSGFEPPFTCVFYSDSNNGVAVVTSNVIPRTIYALEDIARDSLSTIKQRYIEWESLQSNDIMEVYNVLKRNASYKTYKLDKLADIYKYHLDCGRVVKNNKGYFIQSPAELSDFLEQVQAPYMPDTVIEDLSRLSEEKKDMSEESEEDFEYV